MVGSSQQDLEFGSRSCICLIAVSFFCCQLNFYGLMCVGKLNYLVVKFIMDNLFLFRS